MASQHLVENVLKAQDGAAAGVAWPFPSGLASCPLGALIEHFRPHPCEKGDKWAWLDILCLTDVLYVVLIPIALPAPTLSGFYHNS